ncbi:hypothetical protein [Sphingopyxis sp. PAMC25046]|uniref:hypothetical protein n=1 Tax=Sphingopyxis sp. PAMC25046 TaxID=2565556 RepID=UPI001B353695|nr:hypothetical protein [Sphingopyxis sp. PAMC25046]
MFKGLVDIQTPEIWFEAKEASTPPLLMFAQLLVYVRAARKRGEAIPGFLCVIDREKAALELGVKREADYAVLFFADIMHDGRNEAMRNLPARLLFSGDKPVFIIGSEQYELASERGRCRVVSSAPRARSLWRYRIDRFRSVQGRLYRARRKAAANGV